MRKIRLSDTDLELFDIEISPLEYNFYQKHKDAFRTMWREQGKPFWTRYVITFRSFTVKHGVIKQMNIDSPKFENLIDQAFIFIHEQFVDGKEGMAKNFIEDIARLAQNQDKFPALDSKSFARDPFYLRETRELFRSFFGMPDQKSSYLKVYILCPVFMRFGGSICRCLEKWLTAEIQEDPKDDSYWTPPQQQIREKCDHNHCIHDIIMCENCIDDCGEKFFNEKVLGKPNGPQFVTFWKLGDPRFNDQDNPLFAPHMDPKKDWRDSLTAESFREFLYYAKCKYGDQEDKCESCIELREHREKVLKMTRTDCKHKNKKDERELDLTQLEEFRILRDELKELDELNGIDFEHCNRETAMKLGEKLLNIAKDKLPEDKLAQLKDEEERLKNLRKIKKQEKKRQRRRAKAQAQKKNNSPKDSSPSPERNKEGDSDEGDDDDDDDDDDGDIIDKGGDAVEAFKIVRDEKKGVTSVTVTTSKEGMGKKNGIHNNNSKMKGLPDGVSLTIDLIREQIVGLPKLFEFWEGTAYLIAVLNYEEEEKSETEKPTNFTIKVSGVTHKLHENIICKLLFYVQKRKKRKALGWTMDADDIVACILPDEDPELAGLEVTIIRGNFFKAKLSKKERNSLRQSIPHKKILMMLEPVVAKEIREASNGKERLMGIISQVCTNDSKRDRIFRCNELWEKLLSNPEKFDFVLTVDSARVEELKKIGLRPLDIGYEEFMNLNYPTITVCRKCCRVEYQCDCGPGNKQCCIPDQSGNIMGVINNETFKFARDSPEHKPKEPKKKDTKRKESAFETLDAFINNKIDEDFINKKLLEFTGAKDVSELNDDFLKQKLLEIEGKTDLSELDEITNSYTYEQPEPPGRKPVPGMSRNINLSFRKGCREQTLSVKLEAYMPEDDAKNPDAVRRNIQREFQKNYSPDEALTMKSLEIREAIEKVTGHAWCEQHGPIPETAKTRPTNEPRYCEKHRPPAEKTPSANENGPSKQKQQTGTRITIGFKKAAQTPPDSNNKPGDTSKKTAIPLPYTGPNKEKTSSAGENSSKLVDLNKPGNDTSTKNEVTETVKKADVKVEDSKEKNNKDHSGKKDKAETDEKQTLKICGHCGKEEPKRKAFKKCQKCKEEGVTNVRYYCGRDCQVEDWRLKHKVEHRDNLLA